MYPTFSEYPFNLNTVRHLQKLRFHPAMTYIVGENGSGKSTLLEAIAVAMGFNTETEHFEVTRNFLNNHESVLKVLMDGE
jgi:predicted ATPase